jgi:hypothetical protein
MPAAARTMDRRNNRGAPVFYGVSKAVRHEGPLRPGNVHDVGGFPGVQGLRSSRTAVCGGISSTDARSCVQLRSLLRLSVLEGIRQSAGWPRAASTQPDLPHPGPRGRQGRPAARPPSPPGEKRPTGHGRPIPSRSRKTECLRSRPRTDGTGAGRDRGRPGPRWVVQHRKPLVLGGHERSRPANQNRRSHSIHRNDLRRRNSMGRV